MSAIDQTIRVGISHEPAWGGYRTPRVTTLGIKVPHKAANIVDADARVVAAPPRISRTRRFAPSGIPKGVNMTITLPHDCANHLKDVEDVARGY